MFMKHKITQISFNVFLSWEHKSWFVWSTSKTKSFFLSLTTKRFLKPHRTLCPVKEHVLWSQNNLWLALTFGAGPDTYYILDKLDSVNICFQNHLICMQIFPLSLRAHICSLWITPTFLPSPSASSMVFALILFTWAPRHCHQKVHNAAPPHFRSE